jgi:hypothetical protein
MTTQDDDPKPKKPRTRRDGQPDRRSPPVAHQFKKGKSGNASGRPKASPSVKAVAEAIASEKIKVKRRGKETMITRREAMVESVINEAIRKGDHRALKTLADLMGGGEAAGPPPPTVKEMEQRKALADKLTLMLKLIAQLRKADLLVGSDEGTTVAPWVLEEASRRRRQEGPPAPKPETA